MASPVKEAEHILFPFLILEAKSEYQSPGFAAIEKQTAFPIKKLVDAQKALRKSHMGASDNSLVWFLAFSGDEWSLCLCTQRGRDGKMIEVSGRYDQLT